MPLEVLIETDQVVRRFDAYRPGPCDAREHHDRYKGDHEAQRDKEHEQQIGHTNITLPRSGRRNGP